HPHNAENSACDHDGSPIPVPVCAGCAQRSGRSVTSSRQGLVVPSALTRTSARRPDPEFPGSDWCLTLGAATIQAAASEVGRGAWWWEAGGVSGLPGWATWPPPGSRPPVFVVLRAEPALQLRLLQPVDPGDQRECDETRVPQQVWPPQQNRLAEDRGVEREVYG